MRCDPELRRIRRAIARLPHAQRMVFEAARFEDLKNEEIAERMGLEVAEVEALLVKALGSIFRVMDAPPRPWWRFW
ncbi:MAG: RNA polymerase subunit sigma [Sphingomonas sp.]|uniref:sigma factor-like helix-turn-helix DNA-binding protein n=1 Tax=Sphingomonas sp. TaxID=28214 RepID=UPI001B15B4AA|nr:sigma factor-like helix-turn-helix DNA-binding protein [Sphingomonas sp.]MBO9621537.1 RNA polymerase subunit sigma [Sphingomonas sp.]